MGPLSVKRKDPLSKGPQSEASGIQACMMLLLRWRLWSLLASHDAHFDCIAARDGEAWNVAPPGAGGLALARDVPDKMPDRASSLS